MISSFFKISERFIFQQNKLILENTLFKLKDIISENEMSFVEDVCGKKKKYVSKKKLAEIEAQKDVKKDPLIVEEKEDHIPLIVKEEDPLIVEEKDPLIVEEKEDHTPLIVEEKEDHTPLIVEEKDPVEPVLKKNNNSEFIMRELKYNLLNNSSLSNRTLIVKEILKEFKKSKDFDLAKFIVYKKRNIVIVNPVSVDPNRSDENNKMIERDYDELRGCVVYGWNDDGEPLYEETYGCLIVPPTFKEAGHTWREVLQERWEQRSNCSDDENMDEYDGKYN